MKYDTYFQEEVVKLTNRETGADGPFSTATKIQDAGNWSEVQEIIEQLRNAGYSANEAAALLAQASKS